MAGFGIKTAPQTDDWEGMLRIWRAADEMDVFDTAWVFDHLYPLRTDPSNPCMESWVTLSALAQATSRLRIGSMVNGMHFRHPAVTANAAASLDIVSGGRLNLGLGAGWYEAEAEAYGIELGTVDERMTRFEEGVEVIVGLLSNATTTFHGEFYDLEEAWCEPKGPQRPHPPIVIGGTGERRTLRAVARWAQWWDALMADPGEWERLYGVLEEHCDTVGRDVSEITTSIHVKSGGKSVSELADQAGRIFEVGADVVIFTLASPYDIDWLEDLATALEALDT